MERLELPFGQSVAQKLLKQANLTLSEASPGFTMPNKITNKLQECKVIFIWLISLDYRWSSLLHRVCLFVATRAIFQLSGGCHHCR
jgi:hypothetical protein